MIIRPALANEHRALTALAVASKAHWGYSAEQLRLWQHDLTFSPESIAAWPTSVAEDEPGTPVGVVQLNPTTDPWEIEALWVLPSAVGRGVGRALVRHAILMAREAGQRAFNIDADPHAEGFYLACGARRTGERSAPIAGQPYRVRPQLTLPTGGP